MKRSPAVNLAGCFACACLLSSCAGFPSSSAPGSAPQNAPADSSKPYRDPVLARAAPTADESLVIESAKRLIGQVPNAKVTVNKRKFTLDCIGTVSAIFWYMNIDIQKDFPKYSGNGVSRLYQSLESRSALHSDAYPRAGDIIFWDNTWDANADGDRTNDLRTHAGIVLAVDDDGTIHYIHENYLKGVTIEAMNLRTPALASDASGKRINNGMAISTISGGPKPERFLSGDVFSRYGDILGFKNEFLSEIIPPVIPPALPPTVPAPAVPQLPVLPAGELPAQ